MMNGSDDISELTKTIGNMIEEGVEKTKSMPSPCIFRVPEKLRKVKESAYTPQLVSIGPLHSNKEHLKSPMEDIKKHYTKILFKRVKKAKKTPDMMPLLNNCVEKMKASLNRARDCYTEKVEVDVEKMKESLDKARECFPKKVDALEKMKESLDKAKECIAKKVDVLEDVEKMKELLDRAKECFPKKVDALDVPMLVIDGCFILELLYRHHHTHKKNSNDEPQYHCYCGCIPCFFHTNPPHTETSNNQNSNNETKQDFCFDSALARVAIRHDLLLLENQLPFFVLEDLFALTVTTIPNHLPSLSDYLLSYFGNMMNPSEQGGKDDWKPNLCKGVSHILHFLHNQYRKQEDRPEQQDSPKTDVNNYDSMPPVSELEYTGVKIDVSTKTDFNNYHSMPPASELEYAGVKFEVRTTKPGDKGPPFEVQFEEPPALFWCCRRASFKIPTLRISDDTETLLRNLIAFEQCYTRHDRLDFYFTSYAYLMDRLVNTEKDVKVLEKAEVIRSCLGDREEASDMFNNLCNEIVLPGQNFYFAQPCNQAVSYSKRCWPTSLAYLRRTYFANPWTFIAFLVAFIAFGMSVTQFIRGFLG